MSHVPDSDDNGRLTDSNLDNVEVIVSMPTEYISEDRTTSTAIRDCTLISTKAFSAGIQEHRPSTKHIEDVVSIETSVEAKPPPPSYITAISHKSRQDSIRAYMTNPPRNNKPSSAFAKSAILSSLLSPSGIPNSRGGKVKSSSTPLVPAKRPSVYINGQCASLKSPKVTDVGKDKDVVMTDAHSDEVLALPNHILEVLHDNPYEIYESALVYLKRPASELATGLSLLFDALNTIDLVGHPLLHAMIHTTIAVNTPVNVENNCKWKSEHLQEAKEIIDDLRTNKGKHGEQCQGCIWVQCTTEANMEVDKQDHSECAMIGRLDKVIKDEQQRVADHNWASFDDFDDHVKDLVGWTSS